MVFSSLLFLFRFLPIVLALYYIVPKRFVHIRNLVLFVASLLFYSWGEPRYVWIMIFSTVEDYSLGRFISWSMERENKLGQKLGLLTSITINLGILFYFKYSNFFLDSLNHVAGSSFSFKEIVLPIGISFYTFQTMSYTIDVYRKQVPCQKNILAFGTYVALFPQLIAGPIVQYKTVSEELTHRKHSMDLFQEGVLRFVTGLGKKVLLANSIGSLSDKVFAMSTSELPVATAWLGVLAFMFQVYFDFSGYSDMAIGLGKMFGFHFPDNFNYPYMSKSITEFWRRWHMTLGAWFREYVYIPLGGNRCGRKKQMLNIAIVWLLTGFWHGASWNFVLWGVYYGCILMMEKVFLLNWISKKPKWVGHVYSLFFILTGWMIFAIEDLQKLWSYTKVMFGGSNVGFFDGSTIYYLYTNFTILLFCVIGSTNLPKKVAERVCRKENFRGVLEIVYLLFVLVIVLAFLVDASYNPFLYFRF